MVYDVEPLKKEILEEIKELEDKLKDKNDLKFYVIHSGVSSDDESYLRSIRRLMKKHNIKVELIDEDDPSNVYLIYPYIILGTNDPIVKPPAYLNMDGANIGSLLYYNPDFKKVITPCTAEAIKRILYDIEETYYNGRKFNGVTVFGRGNVGRPTAMCMLNDDRTVTICHSKSELYTIIRGKMNDVVICTTGHQDLITLDDMPMFGYIIIDAGISFNNGKIIGDVNPEVYDLMKNDNRKVITTVPGGVGVITPLILLKHVLEHYAYQQGVLE